MVFLPIKTATKINSAGIAAMCKLIRYAITPAAVNAIIAVKNQPPITFNTPATL